MDFTEVQSTGFAAANRSNLRQAIAVRQLQPGTIGREPRLLRVLVIDDDRDTAESTSRLIKLWGHDVRHANTAQAGLEAAVAFRPDFLLLDIAMPHMDGCDIAREVRSTKSLRGCFIVAISGYGNSDQRRRCREAGVDIFLVKPVNLEVLESLLMLESDHCGLLHKTG